MDDEREGLMDPTSTKTSAAGRSFVPKAPFASLGGLARHITIAGFSGLIAGILVGGFGSRLFMRIAGAIADDVAQGKSTEAGFTVGEVTFGGSIGLVIFIGIFSGLAAAVYYVMLLPWITWLGRLRGAMFGFIGFAAASATSDLMNPDNIDFFILKNEPIVVGMIVVLFIVFGIVIDESYRLIAGRMPLPDRNVNPVYYTLAGIGLLIGTGLASVLLGSSGCECEPVLGISGSVLAVGIATAAWWISVLVSGTPRWLGRASAVLGYASVVALLTFGLIRAISDAVDIIR
jgi:hypothetical protein